MDQRLLKEKFENRILDWGYFYPEFAGCETLGIDDDDEIKGQKIYPETGDWVVNDLRGKSGTYGVSHEDSSIVKVKLKSPKTYNIDYTQKPIPLKVSALELMKRYQWISYLFTDWAHIKEASYNQDLFKNADDVTHKYENEKSSFSEDPHLALYWLLHFGFTLDNRYEEVKTLVNSFTYPAEKQLFFDKALAFFQLTDAHYDIKVGKEEKHKHLFLIRRAFLVYLVHSYRNYNPKNLELWWKSISIYPYAEKNLIRRVRWLKNNLKKTNTWDSFEKLIKNKPQDTPLLSYVLACNPNTKHTQKITYANQLLTELNNNKNLWKAPLEKKFAQAIIWDVRAFASQKDVLQKASEFYFQNNEISEKYEDILIVLGKENKNFAAVKTALKNLDTVFEGYDEFKTSDKEKAKYHQKVEVVLHTLPADILLETVTNIKNKELAKRCFVFLWNADIANKKEPLVKLFSKIELSDYHINKALFGDHFPQLIKNENDPNLPIAKAFFTIPEEDFKSKYTWKKSKEAAAMFFLKIAHLPSIFNYLLKTIQQAPNAENKDVVNAIHTKLFTKEYETKINSSLLFNKTQIETMLETICQWFLDYGYQKEAYSSISDCTNPLAEDWIRNKLNDKKWLKQFAHIATFYDPLDEELKWAFENALTSIEDYKHQLYLEYKDKTIHKFWKIEYYDGTYTVTQGKIGTEGKAIEKRFRSKEKAYISGDKLAKSKLKEGYKKVTKI